MPARQPFTHLCQQTARGLQAGRADLHMHTTHSDGTYTAAEVVDLARRCGLSALAITDHDTLNGVPMAQSAAGSSLEVISGVEITAEFRGRELHLLAYFIRLGNADLENALADVRRARVDRFYAMVERLRACGVSIRGSDLPVEGTETSLGRRHLAEAIVRAGRASTIREAFRYFLADNGRIAVAKKRLPVERALELVRGAAGVAAWAHPSYDCDRESLTVLRRQGLAAVEVEYPDFKPGRCRQLREWAGSLGMAITGGSDCHGPGRRAVGARTISTAELGVLRKCLPVSCRA